jgi:hypothetical protein
MNHGLMGSVLKVSHAMELSDKLIIELKLPVLIYGRQNECLWGNGHVDSFIVLGSRWR